MSNRRRSSRLKTSWLIDDVEDVPAQRNDTATSTPEPSHGRHTITEPEKRAVSNDVLKHLDGVDMANDFFENIYGIDRSSDRNKRKRPNKGLRTPHDVGAFQVYGPVNNLVKKAPYSAKIQDFDALVDSRFEDDLKLAQLRINDIVAGKHDQPLGEDGEELDPNTGLGRRIQRLIDAYEYESDVDDDEDIMRWNRPSYIQPPNRFRTLVEKIKKAQKADKAAKKAKSPAVPTTRQAAPAIPTPSGQEEQRSAREIQRAAREARSARRNQRIYETARSATPVVVQGNVAGGADTGHSNQPAGGRNTPNTLSGAVSAVEARLGTANQVEESNAQETPVASRQASTRSGQAAIETPGQKPLEQPNGSNTRSTPIFDLFHGAAERNTTAEPLIGASTASSPEPSLPVERRGLAAENVVRGSGVIEPQSREDGHRTTTIPSANPAPEVIQEKPAEQPNREKRPRLTDSSLEEEARGERAKRVHRRSNSPGATPFSDAARRGDLLTRLRRSRASPPNPFPEAAYMEDPMTRPRRSRAAPSPTPSPEAAPMEDTMTQPRRSRASPPNPFPEAARMEGRRTQPLRFRAPPRNPRPEGEREDQGAWWARVRKMFNDAHEKLPAAMKEKIAREVEAELQSMSSDDI